MARPVLRTLTSSGAGRLDDLAPSRAADGVAVYQMRALRSAAGPGSGVCIRRKLVVLDATAHEEVVARLGRDAARRSG